MDTVRSTTPQFVRCLKPNHRNTPNDFDRRAIVEQLRYSGVLEAARVSRLGELISSLEPHVCVLSYYYVFQFRSFEPLKRSL